LLLATAAKDDTVRIRNAADGVPITVLRVPGKSYLTEVAFSPDVRWVLTLSKEDPPRLWDWKNRPGRHIFELSVPAGTNYTADFSPNSTMLVTTAEEKFARIWNVETGDSPHELPQEDIIHEAKFSPDGRWILTASNDGTVLWDASTGKRLMAFGPPTKWGTAASFSPDGSRVAIGTGDGKLLLYNCEICSSISQLLELASSRMRRTLGKEERRKYNILAGTQ
jgi:WD40 repeat protein